MKKIQLTESQARRAIRKWLFEFSTDSGVSHRASTDDKIAGKLGDDREDQPSSTIPDEIPIAPMSQMSTQLTQDMPAVEDADFVPSTVEELGRAADIVANQVPYSEIEWYYEKIKEIAEEAVEKGNKVSILDEYEPDQKESNPTIQPAQKASEEATNESWKRWSKMLNETLNETRRKSARQRDFARKWKQGDRLDLYRDEEDSFDPDDESLDTSQKSRNTDDDLEYTMSGEVVGGEYMPTQEELEDMAKEMDLELDELPGFDKRRHRTKQEVVSQSGEDAKLRELLSLDMFPNITTLSGMRKMISNQIDPVVHIWFTANDLSQQMTQFIRSSVGQYMFFDALTCSRLFTDDNVLELKGAKQIADALVAIKYSNKRKGPPKKYRKQLAISGKFMRSEVQAFATTVVPNSKDRNKTMQDLLDEYDQLKDQNREVLMDSGLYSAVMSNIVVAPILRRWTKELKDGMIDISSTKNESQVTWEEAGQWLDDEVRSTWDKMGNRRKGKKVEQAMQAQMEFHDALEAARDEAEERAYELEQEGHEVDV
tara:strand:- start:10146 stop:11768 length:1623 start_codon:yes stop_codon:yes gene_type:complete